MSDDDDGGTLQYMLPSSLHKHLALALLALVSLARSAEPATSTRWEKDIAAFEAADAKSPPPRGAVLFVGSSTIRLWKTLAADFPEQKVINRGFGGCQIADCTHFAERIVIPYAPRLIVLRAGGNDIHAGKSPEQVAADFKAFVESVRAKLPDARIAYLPINPTPARWGNYDREKKANELIHGEIEKGKDLIYIDAERLTLGDDGRPRADLFLADRLHLNADGYKLLADAVRPFVQPAKENGATAPNTQPADAGRLPISPLASLGRGVRGEGTSNRLASPEKPDAPINLIYRTPKGVEFAVTAEGLSAVRYKGRTLASGGWTVFNAEPWFMKPQTGTGKASGTPNGTGGASGTHENTGKASGTQSNAFGDGAVKAGPWQRKSLEVAGARHARAVHSGGDLVISTDYHFHGEDLTISACVENLHAVQPLGVVGLSGLTFEFDRPPTGLMPVQHISYFQAHGLTLCHPSFWSKIGGSYATDDTLGVGVSPWQTGLTRTLLLWDYASWEPSQREKSPKRRLLYFAVAPVPPRGARTIAMKLRVSPDRDWHHLLDPYREHFRVTYGGVQYNADHRWIASDYMNHSQQAVSATNPYGFHGGARRLDQAEGVEQFCQTVIPALKSAGGQGVVLWGQGGDDPRGAMYRPDFDILPPEVEKNWPTLAGRFRDAGLRLGVTTRPADLALRLDWRQDQVLPINADDLAHREMLWRRFKRMMDLGCTLFYLDSFGADLEHVKLMRDLRRRMGRDVLCFAEHQCDAMLPYAGGYSETTLHAKGSAPTYRLWSGMENWEIYQWLVPGCQMVSRLYQVEGQPPKDFELPDKFFYRHRVTPLVPVSDFRRVPELKETQPEYVGDRGQWKSSVREK